MLLTAFPSAASASLSWSAGTPVDENGAQPLTAISCPSTSQCTAVDRVGQEVTFNPGSPGTPTPVVLAAGASFTAISCPLTSQCTAVDDRGGAVTFNPASPAGATRSQITSVTLVSIFCPAANQCTALDSQVNEETFNPAAPGSPTAVPIDATRTAASIQCPSTTECVALAYNVSPSSSVTKFNPTAPGTPTPQVVNNVLLIDLSCAASDKCVAITATGGAIGTFDPAAAPANPTPATIDAGHFLNRVACPGPLECVAVDTAGREVTFAPGGAALTPVSIGGGTQVNAVACPSLAQCTAVGDAGTEATFAPQTPNPSTAGIDTGNTLRGVACTSAAQCTAVDIGQEVTFDPLSPGTPAPASIQMFGIKTLACPAANQCTAIDQTGHERTFNPSAPGSATPAAIDTGSVPVGAIACPSTSQCTVVDQTGFVTFDPHAPGSPTQVPMAPGSTFQGVACPSTAQCTAVDAVGNVATFDPTNTTSTVTPLGGHLSAVSCPSTSQCTAVDDAGHAVTFDPQHVLASQSSVMIDSGRALAAITCTSTSFCLATDFEGNAVEGNPATGIWKIEPVPGAASLNGVACVSASQCVAVDAAGRMFLGLEAPISGALPSITGTATQGQTLTEHHGTWSNSPTDYSYEWQQCDAAGNNCTAVSGATAQTFTLTAAQIGHTVRVSETARNAGGAGAPALSAPTAVIQPIPTAPVSASPPTVTGKTKLGQKLSATPGVWTGAAPITLSYQWQGCSPRCANLAGRTGGSLTLGPATIGMRIRVVIRATNALGSAVATSAQTAPVTPTPAQIKRSLQTALVPTGDTAKIRALLVIGGYNTSFTAPTAGTLTLRWYIVPPGGRLARAQKPVLVAVGQITVKAGRRAAVKLTLSAVGRQRLRRARRLTLTGKATFALAHGPRVTIVKTFGIRR